MAALFVLLHHEYLTLVPDMTGDTRLLNFAAVLALGHFAVTVFIVLSGWSLTLSARSNAGVLMRGSSGFYLRRAWRIVPTFWVGLMLSTVLTVLFLAERTGTHWDVVLPFDGHSTAMAALLVNDFWPAGGVPNHAYWSIPVEMHIYLLFPLLIGMRRRVRGWILALSAICFSTAAWFLIAVLSPDRLASTAPAYYGIFALAVVVSMSRFDVSRRRRLALRSCVLFVVVAMMSTAYASGVGTVLKRVLIFDYAVACATLSILLLCRAHISRSRSILAARPLALVGTMAYSVYLTHAPVVQLVWQYGIRPLGLGPSAQFLLLTVMGTGVSLVVGIAFYFLVERHFLQLPRLFSPGSRSARSSGQSEMAGTGESNCVGRLT